MCSFFFYFFFFFTSTQFIPSLPMAKTVSVTIGWDVRGSSSSCLILIKGSAYTINLALGFSVFIFSLTEPLQSPISCILYDIWLQMNPNKQRLNLALSVHVYTNQQTNRVVRACLMKPTSLGERYRELSGIGEAEREFVFSRHIHWGQTIKKCPNLLTFYHMSYHLIFSVDADGESSWNLLRHMKLIERWA